jgi:hypothetical protein
VQCVMNTILKQVDTLVNRTYLDSANLPQSRFLGMICERTQKDKVDYLGCSFRNHS